VTTARSKAIDLRPRDADLLARRGRAEAERERWEQAAADLGKATRMGLNDVSAWHEEALLALARDDKRGYQRTCATMVRHFGGSEDEAVSRTLSWTCALAAEAGPDLKPLVARAERAVSANPSSADDLRALAALLYRSSQFEAAQRRGGEAPRLPGFAHDPPPGLLPALLHPPPPPTAQGHHRPSPTP